MLKSRSRATAVDALRAASAASVPSGVTEPMTCLCSLDRVAQALCQGTKTFHGFKA